MVCAIQRVVQAAVMAVEDVAQAAEETAQAVAPEDVRIVVILLVVQLVTLLVKINATQG